MRALEIAIFLLMISASISLVNSMGILDNTYVYNDNTPYRFWTVSNLTDFQTDNPTILDQVVVYVQFLIASILWIVNIIATTIFIYPVLVDAFGVPGALSLFLQLGIWLNWVIGFVQWRRGASVEGLR